MTVSATFLGADVTSLDRLRSSLGAAGNQLNALCTKETKLIAGTAWYGTDAETFRQSWQSQYAPLMQKVATALAAAATQIGKQLEQQNRASDGGSAGVAAPAAGAVPTNGSGSTGSAGGAVSQPAADPSSGGGAAAPAETKPTPAASVTDQPAAPPAGGASTPGSAGDPVHVKTPWISQYDGSKVPGAGDVACFRAATVMAAESGATVLGPDHRIQVATGENRDGSVSINPAKAAEGRSYIDSELAAGRPVVVGVSYKDASYNVDKITDHFVVVTGRGTDASGNTYYTFNDPATRHASVGADTRPENRFTIAANGNLIRDMPTESRYLTGQDTYLSMVRINKESGR